MTGTIATTIVLVVSPSLNADGRNAYSTRGQLFDSKVDDRFVVKRSPTPFCAAARALLAEGADPAARFVMRHEGSTHDVLRSTVGGAAKLTVADSSTGKPVFVPWVDLRERHEARARSGPPMRETESPGLPGALHARKSTGGRRLIVRRNGPYTRNAYDWTVRLPVIAAAAERIKAESFTIDGEAVVLGPDGLSRFDDLRRREAARTAILYAFDLIEHDSEDLRDRPFLDRKAALAGLLRLFWREGWTPDGRDLPIPAA
jgi:hypothetical protein